MIDALTALKEYVSFGYPIFDIKKQMTRDGFSLTEINSAVNQLQNEDSWKNYMINAIENLKSQGMNKNAIVRLLGISDEEFDSYNHYIEAFYNSMPKDQRLLYIAEKMERLAQEIEEKYIPRFRKIKPKEIGIPNNVQDISHMDARTRLANLIKRASQIPDELKLVKDEISELKKKYLSDLQAIKTTLTEEELIVSEEIVKALEEQTGTIDIGVQVTARHKDNLLAVARILNKIPFEPSAQQKLDFVLEELSKTDAKLYERVQMMLSEFEDANTVIEETLDTIVAVFPLREKHLKGNVRKAELDKIASWLDSILTWTNKFWDKIRKYLKSFKSIDDDIDNNSGAVSSLLSLVQTASIQQSLQGILKK